jgi:RNA polymerase sigma factor (sigma-70 family)
MSAIFQELTELDPLVTAAVSGDLHAFGHLVGATSGLVTSIALAIVRDVEQSQDIAQEVYLAAFRNLGELRNPASFIPWLRQITRNQAHSALRTRSRARRWLAPLPDEPHAEAALTTVRAQPMSSWWPKNALC